jgi:hypothetical protein
VAQLFETIRQAILEDRYVVGIHAAERLEERGIMEWQVVVGIKSARLLAEKPNTRPNPSIELEQELEDGTAVKVIWSWLRQSNVAKLVTVHFFDD